MDGSRSPEMALCLFWYYDTKITHGGWQGACDGDGRSQEEAAISGVVIASPAEIAFRDFA